MTQVIPAYDHLTRLIPDWAVAARADCVPGSGIPHMGATALVLTLEKVVVISQDAQIVHTVFYESIIRVRDIEFKGLVIERDGVLVAPNETFGVEIVYRGAGNHFERSLKLLTRSANNARALVDVVSTAVMGYLDTTEHESGIARRSKE